MTCHVMLDLETLSTRSDAAITQIAAVEFDPTTGATCREFDACFVAETGHIDPHTVLWWMQQPGGAALAKQCVEGGPREALALASFRVWVESLGPAALWSHGATFDIVVLASAYQRHGQAKPWSYRIERDTRTLYALAGGMPAARTDGLEHIGQKHNALFDCHVQIRQVVGALAALRGGGQ